MTALDDDPKDFLVYVIKVITLYNALKRIADTFKSMKLRVFVYLLIYAGGLVYFLGVIALAAVMIIVRIRNTGGLTGMVVEIAAIYTFIVIGLSFISWSLARFESGVRQLDDHSPVPSLWKGILMEVGGVVIFGSSIIYREVIVLSFSVSRLESELTAALGFEVISRIMATLLVVVIDFLYIGTLLFGVGIFAEGILTAVVKEE